MQLHSQLLLNCFCATKHSETIIAVSPYCLIFHTEIVLMLFGFLKKKSQCVIKGHNDSNKPFLQLLCILVECKKTNKKLEVAECIKALISRQLALVFKRSLD